MNKIIIRADDLGYCKAVNYGIYESVVNGIVNNVGVMVNMPSTDHGVDLLKNMDIDFGLHTNICAGKPLTDPSLIPSLIDDFGNFKSSSEYRNSTSDFVIFEEVIIEIEAQLEKFISIFGKKPDYFEGHAVQSYNFFKGLEYVAQKHNLKYSGFSMDGTPIVIGSSNVSLNMESQNTEYDPIDLFKRLSNDNSEDKLNLLVLHPGYLDDYILSNSSLTIPRTLEVEMACSEEIVEFIQFNNIRLMRYNEL